jgi:hypothetical protein
MEKPVFDYVLPPGVDNDDIVDLRGLEAPEPMIRTLEACTGLDSDSCYVAHYPHVPYPLFLHLQARQLEWQVHEQADGSAVILIGRGS